MPQPTPMARPGDPLTSFAAAAGHGRDVFDAALQTFAARAGAFFEDLARDNAEAMQGFGACTTPAEVLAVEQKWLVARLAALQDAIMRVFLGAFHEAESAAAISSAFRLPE